MRLNPDNTVTLNCDQFSALASGYTLAKILTAPNIDAAERELFESQQSRDLNAAMEHVGYVLGTAPNIRNDNLFNILK